MRLFDQSGFTFNELLVAMGLAAFAVMSYSLSSVHLFRQQAVLDRSTVAIYLSKDKLEELQGQRPLEESDNCSSGGEHGLSGKSGVKGIFSRCWRISPVEIGTRLRRIDVTVSWRDHQAHETTLSTLVYAGDEH